jgi:hypothetical protein
LWAALRVAVPTVAQAQVPAKPALVAEDAVWRD